MNPFILTCLDILKLETS